MQTFLPYPDFEQSAKCLDYRRLGKQRVEALQIHNILTGKSQSNAWKNHPAVKMWESYEMALAIYHDIMIKEWINRGYNNNMNFLFPFEMEYLDVTMPKWLGLKEFHAAHRSNLLRKDFNFYSQYDWREPLNLPYIWPK